MRISQESFYGLAVMVALARHDLTRPTRIEDISGAPDLPRSFVAKILQKLVRGGLVGSFRGRQRGYSLALPPERITVKQILEVTEGTDFFHHCMFGRRRCGGRAACFLHDVGMAIRADLDARLRSVTVADLARSECQQRAAR
jgi:Rrf2 family transcriptional regulator, iron-sulfur cluster assembly transcription factor